ncbi:MAG TPA: hypothetical protein VK468_04510, partial [Pyrinomonadaceae bacterium]|nr:hypothetical protein [Pyrinomonadaceae bacterium]
MRNRTILYIPLLFLFALSLTVYVQHANRVLSHAGRLIFQSTSIRVPFEIAGGKVVGVLPEAAEAGMLAGDRVVAIGGRPWIDSDVLFEELGKKNPGEQVVYTIERKAEGGVLTQDLFVDSRPIVMTLRQSLSDIAITLIFHLLLPGVSYLLGFYVAFLRSRDPVAWLLLLLLLGIGSIALEGAREGSLQESFRDTALNLLGIWMLLFGIYFPERLAFDRRHPFAKWIFLIPLSIGGGLNLFEQAGRYFAWRWLWETIDTATKPFDKVLTLLTMTSMGMFFAALSVKSATLENKDSRRRLRILNVGTSIAMVPSLGIVIYRLLSGKEGGFFELVPWSYALFALLALL